MTGRSVRMSTNAWAKTSNFSSIFFNSKFNFYSIPIFISFNFSKDVSSNVLTQSEVINANVSPVSGSMKTINVSILMSAKSLISAVPIQRSV